MGRGSRVRSPPEPDTFTAMYREFVGFGTVVYWNSGVSRIPVTTSVGKLARTRLEKSVRL